MENNLPDKDDYLLIAEKKKGLLFVYISYVLFALAALALVLYLVVREAGNLDATLKDKIRIIIGLTSSIIFIGTFIILIGTFIWVIVFYLKQPTVYIAYRDGVLYFSDGTECVPDEIEEVFYQRAGERKGIMYLFGRLVVRTGQKELKFELVDNVVAAYQRLQKIIDEAKGAKEEND